MQAFLRSAELCLEAKIGGLAAKSLANADQTDVAVGIFIESEDFVNAAKCFRKLRRFTDAASYYWRARMLNEAVKAETEQVVRGGARVHPRKTREREVIVLSRRLKDMSGQKAEKGSEERARSSGVRWVL